LSSQQHACSFILVQSQKKTASNRNHDSSGADLHCGVAINIFLKMQFLLDLLVSFSQLQVHLALQPQDCPRVCGFPTWLKRQSVLHTMMFGFQEKQQNGH